MSAQNTRNISAPVLGLGEVHGSLGERGSQSDWPISEDAATRDRRASELCDLVQEAGLVLTMQALAVVTLERVAARYIDSVNRNRS